MGLTSKIEAVFKKPTLVFTWLSVHGFLNFVPDITYLKMAYRLSLKKKLNLKNPQTFNEKLQWLKLYDRKSVYTTMVDKYAVKQYVAEKIGKEYIIPTLGVWNSFDEIDFDALPDQFVLKCTHDSGGLVICKDKAKLDKQKARNKIEKSLKRDYYLRNREWPYKGVPHKIIAEKFMTDEKNTNGLTDYKFYCFNGEPKFLYVSDSLADHAHSHISYLNLDWSFAPYGRSDYTAYAQLPEKPVNYEEMLEVCRKLSEGVSFLRVDLYEINSRIYFSELTFFPGGGFTAFDDPKHDVEIGNMITLPEKQTE